MNPAAVPMIRSKRETDRAAGARADWLHEPVMLKNTGLPAVAPASTRTVCSGSSASFPSHASRCSAWTDGTHFGVAGVNSFIGSPARSNSVDHSVNGGAFC